MCYLSRYCCLTLENCGESNIYVGGGFLLCYIGEVVVSECY